MRKQKKEEESSIYKNIESIGSTIKDAASLPFEVGQAIHKEMSEFIQKASAPLRTEFRPRDLLQIIVGASILAIPVGFTQETWDLGHTMHTKNVIILGILSIIFIGMFVYYNYYRGKLKKNFGEFTKRVLSTYIFSLLVVAGLLTIIEVAPWHTDMVIAIKRVILTTFPASMSAVVADTIK